MGGPGSGHYVKMVHNGIEYGMMQAYAEGFELLHKSEYGLDVKQIADVWGQGSVVRSWLLELAARAFEADGNDLHELKGYVDDSGEGRWTLESAIDHDVPMPVLTAAIFSRFTSRGNGDYTARMLAALRNQFGGHAVNKALRRMSATAETEPNPLTKGLERLPVRPTSLVIFGATGDLAHRKLLPALYNLAARGRAPRAVRAHRCARRDKEDEDFQQIAQESIEQLLAPQAGRGRAQGPDRRHALRPRDIRRRRGLQRAAQDARASSTRRPAAAQPRLLPLDRTGVLPRDLPEARRGRPDPLREGRRRGW